MSITKRSLAEEPMLITRGWGGVAGGEARWGEVQRRETEDDGQGHAKAMAPIFKAVLGETTRGPSSPRSRRLPPSGPANTKHIPREIRNTVSANNSIATEIRCAAMQATNFPSSLSWNLPFFCLPSNLKEFDADHLENLKSGRQVAFVMTKKKNEYSKHILQSYYLDDKLF